MRHVFCSGCSCSYYCIYVKFCFSKKRKNWTLLLLSLLGTGVHTDFVTSLGPHEYSGSLGIGMSVAPSYTMNWYDAGIHCARLLGLPCVAIVSSLVCRSSLSSFPCCECDLNPSPQIRILVFVHCTSGSNPLYTPTGSTHWVQLEQHWFCSLHMGSGVVILSHLLVR